MTVGLGAPLGLCLWIGVAALAVLDHRRGAAASAVGIRALLLGVCVVVIASPFLRFPVRGSVEVHVIDGSASVSDDGFRAAVDASDARRETATDPVGRIVFAKEGHLQTAPGEAWTPPDRVDGSGSDLAAAVDLAGRWLPRDRAGRLVVWTDGHTSDAEAEFVALAARGVHVEAFPMVADRTRPALVALEPARDHGTPGETIEVRVVAHSGSSALTGELQWSFDGIEQPGQAVSLPAGTSATWVGTIEIPIDAASGLHALQASLGELEARGGVLVKEAPRVWIVGDSDAAIRPLVRWLVADGVDARAVRTGQLGAVPEVEAIVLVDVPLEAGHGATPLPSAWVDGLADHVRRGGGLVVVGGEHTFDLGGWTEHRLAALLPVRLEPRGKERDDAATLVLALDKSGSMAAPVGGAGATQIMQARLRGGGGTGTRFHEVQQAAMSAVRALRDIDRVGVLVVDTEAKWAVPVTSAERRTPINRTIGTLTAAGGGLHVRAALEEGLGALRNADTPLRHLVLFADAGDVDGRTGGIAPIETLRRLARDDITVSVIGVEPGNPDDVAVLEQLALEGGGRFVRAQRYEDLSSLFVAETERMLGLGVETLPIPLVPLHAHPATRGLDLAQAPALLGRNRVERRDDTRIWATTPDGDPLIASHRVGLGEVVAIATDVSGGWGEPWARWKDAGRWWTQTVRHVARPSTGTDAVGLAFEDGRARLTIPTGATALDPVLAWRSAGESGSVALVRQAPGVWEAPDPLPIGRGTVEVRAADGPVLLSLERYRVDDERRSREPNLPAVSRMSRAATGGASSSNTVSLTPWWMLLALLLLPVDAWIRRRPDPGAGRSAPAR